MEQVTMLLIYLAIMFSTMAVYRVSKRMVEITKELKRLSNVVAGTANVVDAIDKAIKAMENELD